MEYTKRLFKDLRSVEGNIRNYVNRLKMVRKNFIILAQRKEAIDSQDYSDLVSESESVMSKKSNRY